MASFDISWIPLICIFCLLGYILLAKGLRQLPSIPLGLLITYFFLLLLMDLINGRPWGGEFGRHLNVAADVVLSWAVARIVFWLLMEVLAKIRGGKEEVLPKITRDFILFLTFVILLLVVLRIRSNVNLASLLTTSAVLTVVIGLAAQATLSNFFSGLIIQAERPFSIGDWIEFGEQEGRVVGISWKSTQVLTREQILIYIPNSVLASSTFTNFSRPSNKKIARLFIGLEYGAPPNEVKRVITEVLDQNPRVLKRPRVNVRLIEFGDFAINYEIRFWHANYAYEPQLKADLNRQLWYALRRNNIRIPFPIRDVFLGHEERKHQERQQMDLRGETREILEKVPILSPLSDAERSELASRVGIQSYGAGELIVKEGEAGDSMYIIRSGACDALKVGENERMKLLSTMRKGDFFGEISLLTGEKRSATIKATEDTSLIVIDKDVFSTVINSSPLISEQIAQVVIERQHKEGVMLEDLEDMAKSSKKFIHKIKQFFGI